MEALLISVNEPQLERCLESIKKQTVPFSNMIHINDDTVPQYVAHNRGLALLKDDWFMLICGDHILFDDAVENAIKEKVNNGDGKVVGHLFGVYDSFMDAPVMGGIGVFRTDVVRSYPYINRLDTDRQIGKKLDRRGWIMKQHRETILATHFDSPDKFQVFKTFYLSGMKYKASVVYELRDALSLLYCKTYNPFYRLAVMALFFGIGKKGSYPGGRSILFEKQAWKEFNALQAAQAS